MPAKAARKVEAQSDARALAREYLDLELKIKPERDRQAELRTELTRIATDRAESFREVFAGLGQLSVSGDKGKKFKGDFLVVDEQVYAALTESRRAKLPIGLIYNESRYSDPTYGRVTPKLF